MHLKAIEMVGFKSFADKTSIELKPGISAIVGPNGCGKSNIVDALRWCLGEMSPKSLRSKHMLDVIFAGASGRSAQNIAEVTLTFDNTHHLLPIDFNEVQVTRRIYRSGESEYYLNKTQCRLKDIRDLFLDTGVGEGYSVLAQGEVDFVMNAKPEDRRGLFEEAAGVSKYKVRREQTIRKLEKVETDISRLNDIISMVSDQMRTLENAAKKARLFQKNKEELKNLEIADSYLQLNRLKEEMGSSQGKSDGLKTDIQKATTALDVAESELTQRQMELDETEKDLYNKNLHMLEIDKQINASDIMIRTEQEREQELVQSVTRNNEKVELSRQELVELKQKHETTLVEVNASNEQFTQFEETFKQKNEVLQSLSNERKALENTKKGLLDELYKINSELSEATNNKTTAQSRQVHKQSELISSQKELERTQREKEVITQELETHKKKLEELSSSTESFVTETMATKETFMSHEKRAEELNSNIRTKQLTLTQNETHLKLIVQSLETDPHRKGAQAILGQNFEGFKGMVGVAFKVPDHIAHWVESLLGKKMQYLVFDSVENAQSALQWLKENNIGRATCFILDRIPEVQAPDISSIPNANSLLTFVQCDPELEKLKRYLLGNSFIAGNTLFDMGTIEGGSDVSESASQEDKNDFQVKDRLESDIKLTKEECVLLEEELKNTSNQIAEMKPVIAEKDKAIERTQLEKEHIQSLISKKSEELNLCLKEISINEEKIKADQADLETIFQAITSSDESIAKLNESVSSKEDERNKMDQQIDAKVEEEHQSEIVAKESEVRLETFNANFQKLKDSLKQWENHIARCDKDINDALSDLESSKTRIEESQNRQKEEGLKIQNLTEEKTKTSQEIESLIQKKQEWEEKNKTFIEEIQGIKEKQTEMTEILHQVDMNLRTLEGDKRNIVSRMQEIYAIDIEQFKPESLPENISIEEIAKLKKRVESMQNSVNLEAPEQFQGLQERYDFLKVQTEDLQKAREDLKSAIQKINAATKEQFRDTFQKVRENFQKIYSTLFQGGTADLIFTNEQNLLETGIDIVAQPAGKKLQNIALLSGGERALTAMSLLFAFFMVRPSPFCVLDEVDAPWDVANIGRFVGLLKEFANKVQFLVVTHHPRTMDVADILYGVTMQEYGISKILSAKLKKEDQATSNKEELAPA